MIQVEEVISMPRQHVQKNGRKICLENQNLTIKLYVILEMMNRVFYRWGN